MPELPEVETVCRGLSKVVQGQVLQGVDVRNGRLRSPVVVADLEGLCGDEVVSVTRRAKYGLVRFSDGQILVFHLGMSGQLRFEEEDVPHQKHDHVIFRFAHVQVRFNDARRFGHVLVIPHEDALKTHALFAHLGVEPLTDAFSADYLHAKLKTRKTAIKVALMDNKVVVGVGNIYASESLFHAGIHPKTAACEISKAKLAVLIPHIQTVLKASIEAGGSTLKDFVHTDGSLGYFQHTFKVYGRAKQPCLSCDSLIESEVIGQRNTFWCPACQKR